MSAGQIWMKRGGRDQSLAHELRCAHYIRWIDRFIGAGEYQPFDAVFNRRMDHVLNAQNVSLNCL